MSPSPRSHIYRLVLILVLGISGFLVVRSLAIPESWDGDRFYRQDALQELKDRPLRFGGNAACAGSGCHEGERVSSHRRRFLAISQGKHQSLACENCHGPLVAHARDGRKVGYAQLTVENSLCFSCHLALVSRPRKFAQFSEQLLYHKLLKVNTGSPCRDCHDPHDPR